MQAIITVDVEADGAWDYGATSRVTVDNLSRLPRFQALCDQYGMKPTYLCTYEVVRDERFLQIVKWQAEGRAEIGAHLHPWTNPPFSGGEGVRDFDPSEYPGYPSELPLPLFRAKLEALTAHITQRSGVRPTSYRAGRWGLAGEHVPVLVEMGYTADCSVTPLMDRGKYKGVRAHGPDFRRAPATPYFLDEHDLCIAGSSALLEVPVTIVQLSALLRDSQLAQKAYQLLKRVRGAAGLLNRVIDTEPVWLRPYPYVDAAKLRRVIELARRLDLPVVEMMLHSSELLPGGSESFFDEASIEKLFVMLEATLRTLRDHGVRGVTLGEYRRAYVTASSEAPAASLHSVPA